MRFSGLDSTKGRGGGGADWIWQSSGGRILLSAVSGRPKQSRPLLRTLFSQWEKLPVDTFPLYQDFSGWRPRGDWRIYDLIHAYRSYGHLLADVNPIATSEPQVPHELHLETLGFNQSSWNEEFPTYGLLPQPRAPLKEIVAALQAIYCGKIRMSTWNYILQQWRRVAPGTD